MRLKGKCSFKLAPLNQVENWVEKLCLSLHERCTPQDWNAWGAITLLFFVKLVSQRQCKTRCTETWNGFGPYHFSYYCRLLLTPDPKETSHTCRRCGQGKYSSIAHTLKVSRQGSQNLSRCNSAFTKFLWFFFKCTSSKISSESNSLRILGLARTLFSLEGYIGLQ